MNDDDDRARLVFLFALSAVAFVCVGIALGWILDAFCH